MELYFDGACEPNPGTGAAGFVLYSDGAVVAEGKKVLVGACTNNMAEYSALWLGIKEAVAQGATDLIIYGDSKLVVEQVNKRWKAKNPRMLKARDEVLKLLENLQSWELSWKGRDFNTHADGLSKAALEDAGITSRY